jgi:hypothetical protein
LDNGEDAYTTIEAVKISKFPRHPFRIGGILGLEIKQRLALPHAVAENSSSLTCHVLAVHVRVDDPIDVDGETKAFEYHLGAEHDFGLPEQRAGSAELPRPTCKLIEAASIAMARLAMEHHAL